MKRSIVVALGTGAVISSAAAFSIGAGPADARAVSRQAYETEIRRVETARAAMALRCDSLSVAFEREVCRAEASSMQMVRAAEIEEGYRRTEQSARAVQRARIDARYQIDRARCAAFTGLRRDKCLIRAHAAKGRAMLDAAAPYEVRF